MTFHAVLESLLSVSNATLASHQTHGFADDDLLSAAPLAGAESVFLVLTAAGPVHEVQQPGSLVDLLWCARALALGPPPLCTSF